MKKFSYIMKLAVVMKDTQCILDTEYVHLSEEEGTFCSHIALLDKVEMLRKGISINEKYEIITMPVSIRKGDIDFIYIDPESKEGKWYILHSKEAEIAISDLKKKK